MKSWFDLIYEEPVPLGEQYPLFNRVSVETSSYCNRQCSFCPISSGRRPRQELMKQATYDKLCAELSDLSFGGVVQMFLLNEPTLDKTFHDKCAQMREACPKCCEYVSTNADVLKTVENLVALFDAGVTCVNLNVYDGGEEQLDRLTLLCQSGVDAGEWELTKHKYAKHSCKKRLVYVTDMRPERMNASSVDMYHGRSKEERSAKTSVPQLYCARPHRHIVIMHDGRVPLCCALDPSDPQLQEDGLIVGSVADSTLLELWNSEMMFMYRWRLQHAHRDLPGCNTCTHKMAYSHVVRQVTADTVTLAKWKGAACES